MTAATCFVLAAGLYLLLQGMRTTLMLRERVQQRAALAAPVLCRVDEVDVLVPILGGDPLLPQVLGAQLTALPGVRWHWLLDAGDRDTVALCETLAARQPDGTRLHLWTFPAAPPGCNPKLHKLALVQPALEGTVVLVLDDDTVLGSAGLDLLLGALSGHALATGLARYVVQGGAWSRLLAQFVNDQSGVTYLPLLRYWPAPSLNGMGYALRRATLEACGGFAALRAFLTDDLALAEAVRARGGVIAQTLAPLLVRTTIAGPVHWWRQMHRWFLFALLLLPRQQPAVRAAIAGLHGAPPLVLALALVSAAGSASWTGLVLLLGLRAVLLACWQQRLWGAVLYRPLFSELTELAQPLQLLHALLVRRIRWRSRRYRVHAADRFEPWP